MRKLIYTTGLIALLTGMSACTDREQDQVIPDKASTEVTLAYTVAGTSGDPAPRVLVFGNRSGNYTYVQTVSGGWTSGAPGVYTRSVQLPVGDYKFLYAAGYGVNTRLSPAAPSGDTGFDAVSFRNLVSGGYILPADELYMQYPLADADRIYSISGPATVTCTLRRVVSQVVFHLKRGHKSGEIFVPEPYADPVSDNIGRHLESVGLILTGVAQGFSVAGSEGEGSVSDSLDVAGAVPDTDGFVTVPGPFFIPRTGKPLGKIDFTYRLQPGNSLDQVVQEVDLSGYSVGSNQQLEITLWFDSFDIPVGIEVEIDTAFSDQSGDEGIWN